MIHPVTLVIPCHNEEGRLHVENIARLLARPHLSLLLVDDGSSDRTGELLRACEREYAGRVTVMSSSDNRGKAEAVRTGLARAVESAAWAVGYVDADFSTPPREVLSLLKELESQRVMVTMGSRVLRLGSQVRRRALRHYVGRIFASAASLALGIPAYDTQCGAKVFRVGPALRAALATPFRSAWAFDVELIGRLLRGAPGFALDPSDFLEVPLRVWIDQPGSKVRVWHAWRAVWDLARIAWDMRRQDEGGRV